MWLPSQTSFMERPGWIQLNIHFKLLINSTAKTKLNHDGIFITLNVFLDLDATVVQQSM